MNEQTLHFGLGSRLDPVDLKITWPDGFLQLVDGVEVDQMLTVGHSGSILNAARVGDLAGVQALLDAGVDMNAKDGNGWTALHYAADYGYEEIAELLIAKGADVNAKNPNMLTPLYFAAQNNRKEVANC